MNNEERIIKLRTSRDNLILLSEDLISRANKNFKESSAINAPDLDFISSVVGAIRELTEIINSETRPKV